MKRIAWGLAGASAALTAVCAGSRLRRPVSAAREERALTLAGVSQEFVCRRRRGGDRGLRYASPGTGVTGSAGWPWRAGPRSS